MVGTSWPHQRRSPIQFRDLRLAQSHETFLAMAELLSESSTDSRNDTGGKCLVHVIRRFSSRLRWLGRAGCTHLPDFRAESRDASEKVLSGVGHLAAKKIDALVLAAAS